MLQMVVSVPHALLPAQAAAIECTVTGPNVFIDKNFHDLSFLTNLTFSNLHCDAMLFSAILFKQKINHFQFNLDFADLRANRGHESKKFFCQTATSVTQAFT